VVGAGIGAHVVKEIAQRIGHGYAAFDALLDAAPQARAAASQCAPGGGLGPHELVSHTPDAHG